MMLPLPAAPCQVSSSANKKAPLVPPTTSQHPSVPISASGSSKQDDKVHGWMYHFKLLMLLIFKGISLNDSTFEIGVEFKDGKKFDDICVTFGKSVKEYHLFQVKSKKDESKKIEYASLLSASQGDYSLGKYYFSLCDFKKNLSVKNSFVREVVIVTNIDVDLADLATNNVHLESLSTVHKLLDVKCGKQPARYRFQKGQAQLLKPFLEEYMPRRLALRMIDCIKRKIAMRHHEDLFCHYHLPLANEVIVISSSKKKPNLFSKNFVDGAQLSSGAIRLREEYIDLVRDVKKEYEYLQLPTINDALTAKQGKIILSKKFGQSLGSSKDWPSNTISEATIEDFFDHLVLAVNQPNEDDLDSILKNEIKHVGGEDLNEHIFYKFLYTVIGWYQGKRGDSKSLNFNQCKKLFDEAKAATSSALLSGITLSEASKIEQLEVTLFRAAPKISHFLNVATQQIMVIESSFSTILTKLSVYHVLHKKCYMIPSHLLFGAQQVLDGFLESEHQEWLVVDFQDDGFYDIQHDFASLYRKLQSKSRKKIIIMYEPGNAVQQNIPTSVQFPKLVDDQTLSLQDLTEDSAQKLLCREIIFHGSPVKLGSIIDDSCRGLIRGPILCNLILQEKVEIGRSYLNAEYEKIRDFFIDRRLNRHVEIKKSVLKDKSFRVESGSVLDSVPNQDILVLSKVGKDFEDYCCNFPDRNVHWLQEIKEKLIWRQSQGDLSKLGPFILRTGTNAGYFSDMNERQMLISAKPGMGKSILLSHFPSKRGFWLIRINLVDHCHHFSSWEETDMDSDEEKVFKFVKLVGCGESSTNPHCRAVEDLFDYFYKNGKVTLLIDGFDEVMPDYKNQITKLLKVLRVATSNQMCVTTRPSFRVEAENALRSFAFDLEPVEVEESENFILQFWIKNSSPNPLNGQLQKIFANQVFESLPLASFNDLLCIPLHARMFAEVFLNDCKNFCQSYGSQTQDMAELLAAKLAASWDIGRLYYEFANLNFERELRKEMPDYDKDKTKPKMKKMISDRKDRFWDEHETFAAYSLLGEGKESNVSSPLMNQTRGKLSFLHRTYAEYFAAEFIWRKIISQGSFMSVFTIISKDMTEVAKFLCLRAKWDFQRGKLTEDSKLTELFTLLTEKIGMYGPSNKTKATTKHLLGIIDRSTLPIDVRAWERDNKMKLLCVSAEMGFNRLLTELQRQFTVEELKSYLKECKWFYSPVWLAADNSHREALSKLFTDFGYDPAWEDKDRMHLIQRVLQNREWDVLRMCLTTTRSDVFYAPCGFDCRDDCDIVQLPLIIALNDSAPEDVIRLLAERTSTKHVLSNKYYNLPGPVYVAGQLPHYDETTSTVLAKKIADSSTSPIHVLVFELQHRVFDDFLRAVIRGSKFSCDVEAEGWCRSIELCLKERMGFNSYDSRHRETILQRAQKFNNIMKVCSRLKTLWAENNYIKPMDVLLKALIVSARENSGEVLLKYADHNLNGGPINSMRNSVICLAKTSPEFPEVETEGESTEDESSEGGSMDWEPADLESYEERSERQPAEGEPAERGFVDGTSAEGESTEEGSAEGESVGITQAVQKALRCFKTEYENRFKRYCDDYSNILSSYEDFLDYERGSDSEKRVLKKRYEALDAVQRQILARVLMLFKRQGYSFQDAVKEVKEKMAKHYKISVVLKRGPAGVNGEAGTWSTEKLWEIFNVNHDVMCDKTLEDLVSDVFRSGTEDIDMLWNYLQEIGDGRVPDILSEICKFSETASKIFVLLSSLNEHYKYLVSKVKENNDVGIETALGEMPTEFRASICNGQDNEIGSPLYYAARNGFKDTTSLLLKYGANPNLIIETSDPDLNLMSHVFDNFYPYMISQDDANSDMGISSENWDLESEESLSLDRFLIDGVTPLVVAVLYGHKDVVEVLIKGGARLEVTSDQEPWSALVLAVLVGNIEIVNKLLDNGADPNSTISCAKKPLKALILKDEENKTNYYEFAYFKDHERKFTVLHFAALHGKLEVVRLLLTYRAAPNAQMTSRETPLDASIIGDSPECEKLLREHGALRGSEI